MKYNISEKYEKYREAEIAYKREEFNYWLSLLNKEKHFSGTTGRMNARWLFSALVSGITNQFWTREIGYRDGKDWGIVSMDRELNFLSQYFDSLCDSGYMTGLTPGEIIYTLLIQGYLKVKKKGDTIYAVIPKKAYKNFFRVSKHL